MMQTITRKPIIRDETGSPVFGVAPVSVLEKALRSWTPEELAEYKEFVLINDELSLRRIENEVTEAGGHPVEPKGIDSQTYWLPESGLVGVFDLRKEYDKALAASLESGYHPLRRFFASIEYRSNLRIGLCYDACLMLASARLVLLRRETGLPLSRLRKRSDSILFETTWLFYRRMLFSTALPAILLLLLRDLMRHIIGGKSSAQPDKSGHMEPETISNLTGLEESIDAAPREVLQDGERPETPREYVETQIADETGGKHCGVDAAKLLKRMLRLWKPKERSGLTKIILVGNDLAAKQQENRLLQQGARPLYAMRPEGRTYALKREGAIQIINLARINTAALINDPRTLFSFVRKPLLWFYYRTRLQTTFATALPYGLAYVQLAQIERDKKLSRKAASDLASSLYWDLKFVMLKRVRYWTMVPGWLMVFALFWLRNRLGRTATTGAKKPGN
jgi:hypothetical protein